VDQALVDSIVQLPLRTLSVIEAIGGWIEGKSTSRPPHDFQNCL
jgi:hypothetical protein